MPRTKTTEELGKSLARYQRLFYLVWAVIGIGCIIFFVYRLLGTFRPLVDIVLTTAMFSFILRRPVAFFERHGIKRGFGAVISILLAIAFVVLVAVLIFPPIFGEIGSLIQAMPSGFQQAYVSFNEFYDTYADVINNSQLQEYVSSAISSAGSFVRSYGPKLAENVISLTTVTVKTIITVVMSMVATFWILKDMPRIGAELKVLAGPTWALDLEMTRAIGVRVFGGYVRGLIVTSSCTGLIAAIGFTIVGVPYAGLLGLITGLLNVIPYIGPWTGGIIAAIAGLFVSPWVALASIIVSIIAQQFTDNFITPHVYGSAVELHPALVIFALSAGEVIAGVLGMIIAVPMTAALKAVVIYWFEKKTGRQLVSTKGALFRGKPSDPASLDPAYDATGGTVTVSYDPGIFNAQGFATATQAEELVEERLEEERES